MAARNPMAPWHTCPRHDLPLRDGEDCPACAAGLEAVQERQRSLSKLRAIAALVVFLGLGALVLINSTGRECAATGSTAPDC